jgi:CubicO group peptidase (beta-lactamase class C family)
MSSSSEPVRTPNGQQLAANMIVPQTLKDGAGWEAEIQAIEAAVKRVMELGRIPGAALAIVNKDRCECRAFGTRDVAKHAPMTTDTLYPIASTTKSINATLLAMLVHEGVFDWDEPIRTHLPRFRLWNKQVSERVTLRDLVMMRSGLPRHDYVWYENQITRAELLEGLPFLRPSARFREKFQYNNLTVTLAGHVAEVAVGCPWEELVSDRLLRPLRMTATKASGLRPSDTVTTSYHEDLSRKLVPTLRMATEVAAPSGGAIYSTIEDMALWTQFNLRGGTLPGTIRDLSVDLSELQSPQIELAGDKSGPSSEASYGMGWFVDEAFGLRRISHGGYLHDVHSEVAFIPDRNVGVVSFVNFGCSRLASAISEFALAILTGNAPAACAEERLARYEEAIQETRYRNDARPTETKSLPRPLQAYSGRYRHPAYGTFKVEIRDGGLWLDRGRLKLPLVHSERDNWFVKESPHFPIHAWHAFEPANDVRFHVGNGEVTALSLTLEQTVAPIRFDKEG